jgi:hypothetical protein
MSQFASLELLGWRQFDRIALDLTRQTTVLTGANGTGKTTILNVLGHHFGWRLPLVATPYLGKRTAKRIWSDIYAETILDPDQEIPNDRVQIGTIGYSDGAKCQIISNHAYPHSSAAIVCDLITDTEVADGRRQG